MDGAAPPPQRQLWQAAVMCIRLGEEGTSGHVSGDRRSDWALLVAHGGSPQRVTLLVPRELGLCPCHFTARRGPEGRDGGAAVRARGPPEPRSRARGHPVWPLLFPVCVGGVIVLPAAVQMPSTPHVTLLCPLGGDVAAGWSSIVEGGPTCPHPASLWSLTASIWPQAWAPTHHCCLLPRVSDPLTQHPEPGLPLPWGCPVPMPTTV